MATATKATKPEVLDAKGKPILKTYRVISLGDDNAEATVTNLEHQRGRVVIMFDGAKAKNVRPAAKVRILRTKQGKPVTVAKA